MYLDGLFSNYMASISSNTVLFMHPIFQSSVSMLDAATKKYGLDEKLMPFGQLKKDALLAGKKILLQIG